MTPKNWYCEVLHTEFGPLSWDDLRGMAMRGTLRPKDRVRQEEGDWRVAGDIDQLFPAPSVADSTDFEIGTPNFNLGTPRSASSGDEQFDFDV